MSSKTTELKCIHGINHLSCVHCHERTKKEVIAELREAESRDGVVFEYIDAGETEALEVDTDYDIDIE